VLKGCPRQAQAKSARVNFPGIADPSRPCELVRIPCQNVTLRNKLSLVENAAEVDLQREPSLSKFNLRFIQMHSRVQRFGPFLRKLRIRILDKLQNNILGPVHKKNIFQYFAP